MFGFMSLPDSWDVLDAFRLPLSIVAISVTQDSPDDNN
jgi:hypothetical protein